MDNLAELFEAASVGEQPKRAAVVIGRFSTPTAAHYALISQVKKYIRANPDLKLNPVPIVVIIDGKETGKDKSRNPLTADERIMFMDGSGNAPGVKFLKATSALDALEAVRKAGYEPIAIGAGSDRAEKYRHILDKYFNAADGSKLRHHTIELNRDNVSAVDSTAKITIADKMTMLDNVLKYTDKDIPISMISASLARHAVKKNDLDKFTILTGLSDKPSIAQKMFDKIKAAMSAGETDGAA
jgi:hypothetical protein